MSVKLDIGGGVYPRDGYLNVDAFVESADIRADMRDIPLPDASVDEIYSSHALEHMSKHDIVPILKEWKRLLKVGGVAVIEVPDLRWCCENWLYRLSNDWHMDTIFGQQTTPGEFHKTGFTPDIMAGYLREAGLTLLAQRTVDSHGQPTLQFEVQRQS